MPKPVSAGGVATTPVGPSGTAAVLLLTGVLVVFPFARGPALVFFACVAAVIAALALRRAQRAPARLGVFVLLYLGTILLGSRYSQLSLSAAILLYLVAVARVPRLQGDQPWRRWGRFDRDVRILCLIAAAGAGLGVLLWHRLAKPDAQDLLDRFVPDAGLALLVLGGLVFALVNAAVEEIAYRGIVLDALRDVRLSLMVVLALQAFAFGTLHFAGFPRGWSGVGLATIYGIVLGAIRVRADGILAPWVAHVLTDIVIVSVLLGIA
jgi:hypothetical protein